MSHNPDAYYSCTEVSNSDLTALKNLLHPVPMPPGVKERAFRFGTLVDAIITEPERVNYYQLTVDDENTPMMSFAMQRKCTAPCV